MTSNPNSDSTEAATGNGFALPFDVAIETLVIRLFEFSVYMNRT